MPSYKVFLEYGCYLLLSLFVIPIRIHKELEKELFTDYLREFNKSYPDEKTFNLRMKAFMISRDNIIYFNSKRSNTSARYGFTKFSDLLPEEFIPMWKDKQSSTLKAPHKTTKTKLKRKYYWDVIPNKVDWREKNSITKIKNQKTCGACWAFAVTETIESMKAIKTNNLKELSVQQLIDCSTSNSGCSGGDICSLSTWIQSYNVSVVEEDEYPLTYINQTCQSIDKKEGVRVKDFSCDSLVGAEDIILALLAFKGPVAVAINAQTWQHYVGGIIQFHCNGNPSDLNHAVEIVGYDLTGEVPYYIIRNSWGKDFGDKGYVYVAVGSNMCGLANEVLALSVI